jgi:exodeoxyribonuclease V beta subunit
MGLLENNFDAGTIELTGTNLIEASAGTGKTYSIAILALRLVLEKGIPLPEILMVTFTKAAVAELHERVRLFLKQAQQSIQGIVIKDETIVELVKRSESQFGSDVIKRRLYEANLLLDELSVITIHSFCQQTLREFAFETNQLFGAEMVADIEDVLNNEVNEFWRRYITTLDVEILERIGVHTLRADLKAIVKEHLEGKRYAAYDEETNYSIASLTMQGLEKFQISLQESSVKLEASLRQVFDVHKEALITLCNESKSTVKKRYIPCLDNAMAFVNLIWAEKTSNKLTEAFPVAFMSEIEKAKFTFIRLSAKPDFFFKEQLNCFAIQEIGGKVHDYMVRNNFLGYNDLIGNLHKALTEKPNPALVAALQHKYKAVFVDEFQDTDREQYEIFKEAFFANTILFLIGDPKQSIYAWRKADIHTYFQARNDVQRQFDMNVNFRSSTPLIEAMNDFFLPAEDFDTFSFPDKANRISYTKVQSPVDNKKGVLLYDGVVDMPVSLFSTDKKETVMYGVALQIQALLTDEKYFIAGNGQTRRIKPSDIGILVRKNSDGIGVKNYLAQKGIPAILMDDKRIFASQEAKDLLSLLEAIYEPTFSSINKALLNSFTGFVMDDILKLDEEKILAYFQEYKNIWQHNGVYPALTRFLKDFNLRETLMNNHAVQGQRIISNLIQLMELLNQSVHIGSLNQEELIIWFKRGVNGMRVSGDEYQTRMESDEEAVKIVTIHKSKGLEYPIVFAPFLDLKTTNTRHLFQKFRNPETGEYLVRETRLMTDEEVLWNETQLEQENRRLIYVSVTRAVYKCFVYTINNGHYKSSSLKPFVAALKLRKSPWIEIDEMPFPEVTAYRPDNIVYESKALYPQQFSLSHPNWYKLSYTGLSFSGKHLRKDRTDEFADDYEQFVFNKLRFGAASGNLLHNILEEVDFQNEGLWENKIERSLKEFNPNRLEEFAPFLFQLVDNVVNVPIAFGNYIFSLKKVHQHRRISELEFDFPVDGLQTNLLYAIVHKAYPISIRSFEQASLEGIMNGKVDLFFEYNGRYYILDWKSNYLGYKPEDYNEESVKAAMDEHNYHLQYLIYTVAVKKYLSARLPDFDYEKQFGCVIYLFLRGIRKDSNNGIFTARPGLKLIEKIEGLLNKNVS